MNHFFEEVQIAEFSVVIRIKVFANTNPFIFAVLILKIYNFSEALTASEVKRFGIES